MDYGLVVDVIIRYVIPSISLISTIILARKSHINKIKRINEEKISDEEKSKRIASENENFIRNQVEKFVGVAEHIQGATGHFKKEWVQTKTQQKCLDDNVPYYLDKVNEFIEGFVTFSKSVNKREKDPLNNKRTTNK